MPKISNSLGMAAAARITTKDGITNAVAIVSIWSICFSTAGLEPSEVSDIFSPLYECVNREFDANLSLVSGSPSNQEERNATFTITNSRPPGFPRLLPFQTERVDILGSRIAKQQRRVSRVKPKPPPKVSRGMHILCIGDQFGIPTRDGDSENTRTVQKRHEKDVAAI